MSEMEQTGGKRWNGQISHEDGGGKRLPENIAKTLAAQNQQPAESGENAFKPEDHSDACMGDAK